MVIAAIVPNGIPYANTGKINEIRRLNETSLRGQFGFIESPLHDSGLFFTFVCRMCINRMKKKLILFFCLLLPFLSMQAQSFYVSPTKYDYSGAAKQITAGCTTDYERVRAI